MSFIKSFQKKGKKIGKKHIYKHLIYIEMCKLTKEEFLNTRFKENDIEYQTFSSLLEKHTIKNDASMSLFIEAMRDIAKKKRDLYKQELKLILSDQEDEFNDDQLLAKLKLLKDKNNNGELTTGEYLFKVDAVLREGKKKKRKYMQIDGLWTRIE